MIDEILDRLDKLENRDAMQAEDFKHFTRLLFDLQKRVDRCEAESERDEALAKVKELEAEVSRLQSLTRCVDHDEQVIACPSCGAELLEAQHGTLLRALGRAQADMDIVTHERDQFREECAKSELVLEQRKADVEKADIAVAILTAKLAEKQGLIDAGWPQCKDHKQSLISCNECMYVAVRSAHDQHATLLRDLAAARADVERLTGEVTELAKIACCSLHKPLSDGDIDRFMAKIQRYANGPMEGAVAALDSFDICFSAWSTRRDVARSLFRQAFEALVHSEPSPCPRCSHAEHEGKTCGERVNAPMNAFTPAGHRACGCGVEEKV